jgi:hypothetical protein
MKLHLFLVSCLAAVCFVGIMLTAAGGVPSRPTLSAPQANLQQSTHSQIPKIRASLKFSSVTVYRDIRIIDGQLVVVYLPKGFKPGPKYDCYQPQTFWFKTSSLKRANIKLSARELNEFAELVDKSGFFALPRYSGAKYAKPYPTDLFVEINGKKKTATYLPAPHAKPIPQAFSAVQDWLIKITAAKIKDF